MEQEKVMFVHYDLHHKTSKHILYGVVSPNIDHRVKDNKWLWILDGFMTANEIYLKYGIARNELPASSRKMDGFRKQIETQYNLSMNINPNKVVPATDWNNIQQIKSLRRGDARRNSRKSQQSMLKFNKKHWMELCVKSWYQLPAIPIVVNENKNNINQHWIEWIKLIQIDINLYIGVSCKYLGERNNEWVITSICLDKGDVENKHRLLGLSRQYKEHYMQYFNHFNTSFAEIQWIKSH